MKINKFHYIILTFISVFGCDSPCESFKCLTTSANYSEIKFYSNPENKIISDGIKFTSDSTTIAPVLLYFTDTLYAADCKPVGTASFYENKTLLLVVEFGIGNGISCYQYTLGNKTFVKALSKNGIKTLTGYYNINCQIVR